jgi:hypothetical protein
MLGTGKESVWVCGCKSVGKSVGTGKESFIGVGDRVGIGIG